MMLKKKLQPFVLAFLVGCSATALAASAATESGTGNSGGNAAVDAALKTCAASVAKDAGGGPDQTAMTACMTKAGFTKPVQGGERRPPPAGAAPGK